MVEAGIEQSEAGWLTPELLRLKGELLLLQSDSCSRETGGGPLPAGAGWGAPARGIVLGVARRDEPRPLAARSRPPADAIACLQPVYDRFTEGFGTADLIAAKQLLDELGDAEACRSSRASSKIQAKDMTRAACPDGRTTRSRLGPFRLLAAQRLLLEGDKPVRLGSRAFDILTALVERAGEVVGKEELIARAWPADVRRRSESEDPGQRFASCPRRRPRRQSLRRHRCRTGLQFRRADTQGGAVAGLAAPDHRAGGAAQSAVRDNADDRPRGNRGSACHTTFAPAPGDDRRARRHRQDHGRPRRRRADDRRL